MFAFISNNDEMVNNNKVTINTVLLSRGGRKKEKHVERRKESTRDLETQKNLPNQNCAVESNEHEKTGPEEKKA
jgi:hypothetical protein